VLKRKSGVRAVDLKLISRINGNCVIVEVIGECDAGTTAILRELHRATALGRRCPAPGSPSGGDRPHGGRPRAAALTAHASLGGSVQVLEVEQVDGSADCRC
jgi:hypothetical protein